MSRKLKQSDLQYEKIHTFDQERLIRSIRRILHSLVGERLLTTKPEEKLLSRTEKQDKPV